MDERHNGNPMHDYVRGVEAEVARKYYEIVKDSYQRNRLQLWRKCRWRLSGFSFCNGWADRLCPLDKLVRFSRVRCKHCWRQLRDAWKEKTAAKKAVADLWAKFEAPPTSWPQIDSSEEEEEAEHEWFTPDEEHKADETDPLAAHKLATLLGARGECGFESLRKDKRQILDKMNVPPNVITREERKAASRCGGLPVRLPYLLPRDGMPNVADTEDLSLIHI